MTTRITFPRARDGFTLMEVNVALLLLAIGLLGLLSLFPVGLRQSSQASSDTAQAAFASGVLNAIRANASTVTDWSAWSNTATFPAKVLAGVSVPVGVSGSHAIVLTSNTVDHIDDYLVPTHYIGYTLSIDPGSVPSIWKATMQVTDRKFMSVNNSPVYSTAMYFMGM